VAARRRSTARAAVLPARRPLPDVSRLVPSGRSVLIGLVVFLLAVGAYLAARETSLFAVRSIDVRGASPEVRANVRAALAPEVGRSLLRVDGSELNQRLADVTGVASFGYDRAFPHTLKVIIRPERPVLVLRQRASAYVVSATGRVLQRLPNPRLSRLPRLYVRADVRVAIGKQLPGSLAGAASAAAALRSQGLPVAPHLVTVGPDGVTLRLPAGLDVRLGDAGDLRLKLAIARRILQSTGVSTAPGGYLDVSVPERPVLATNSQVKG